MVFALSYIPNPSVYMESSLYTAKLFRLSLILISSCLCLSECEDYRHAPHITLIYFFKCSINITLLYLSLSQWRKRILTAFSCCHLLLKIYDGEGRDHSNCLVIKWSTQVSTECICVPFIYCGILKVVEWDRR